MHHVCINPILWNVTNHNIKSKYVLPDQDPNCLQRLSTDDISRQSVKQKRLNATTRHVQQRQDQTVKQFGSRSARENLNVAWTKHIVF